MLEVENDDSAEMEAATGAAASVENLSDADGHDVLSGGRKVIPEADASAVAGPSAFPVPIGARTGWVDPASIDEHPLLKKHFDLGTEDENAELRESIAGRQYARILVTGERCAGTPPGVALDGRRRRRQAMAAGRPVEVEYLDDLTDAGQFAIIVHANIAAGLARRLTERRKAELEQALRHSYGDRHGERSDLTPAGNGGSERGETRDLIAKRMKESRHAVDDREVIFCHPVSPEALKQAVDGGSVKRTRAAELVRAAAKDADVAAVLEDARRDKMSPDALATHPVVVAAKGKVIVETQKLQGVKPKKDPPPKPPKKTEAWATLVAGSAAIQNILGHKLLVEVTDDGKVHVVVVGAADGDPSIYVANAPTTRATWPVDVAAVVAELPAEVREGVTVSEVEMLDPVRCPKCGGTRFYSNNIGCVTCTPPLWQPDYRAITAQAEREVAEMVGDADWNVYKHTPGYIEADLRRRLKDDERATNRVILRVGLLLDERRKQAHRAAVEEIRRRDPLGFGHRGEVQDLRYPRTRVRVATPHGEVAIVLWERERDWRPHGAYPNAACVVTPHCAAPFYLCNDPWSSRSHLRKAVREALAWVLPETVPSAGGAPPEPNIEREDEAEDMPAVLAKPPHGGDSSPHRLQVHVGDRIRFATLRRTEPALYCPGRVAFRWEGTVVAVTEQEIHLADIESMNPAHWKVAQHTPSKVYAFTGVADIEVIARACRPVNEACDPPKGDTSEDALAVLPLLLA